MEWSEINAAWGQTALLLWALARKVNITFNKYQVVPYGAFSYVKNLSDDKTLPLYGSGGFRMIFGLWRGGLYVLLPDSGESGCGYVYLCVGLVG